MSVTVSPDMKLVIVCRRDLKIRKGKYMGKAAQIAAKHMLKSQDSIEAGWLARTWAFGKHYRIAVVKVKSEGEFLEVMNEAKIRGLFSSVMHDAGMTQISPTKNVIGCIGPHFEEDFVGVSDHLTLM